MKHVYMWSGVLLCGLATYFIGLFLTTGQQSYFIGGISIILIVFVIGVAEIIGVLEKILTELKKKNKGE